MNMGFPDVCLTPAAPSPVPIPYPNMANHAMASPFCSTILLSMMPALNTGSQIPMTSGDEAGTANPMFKQAGTFTMGSSKVFLQGMPAITLTCQTTGNNMNNPVGMVSVPSSTNVLYTQAPHEPPAAPREAGGPSRLAVVHVTAFLPDTPARARAALRAAPDGVVFDLRGCPGGELGAAIELARDLLPEGAVIVSLVDGDGDVLVHRARGDAYGGAVFVLVDAGTASAAEVFAGCLKAHGRAVILGHRTYGKGVARAWVNGAMVDVARVMLPDGSALDGGVEPTAAP
jgi:carboxyl-terminal processing protease